jgi:hypothetical protein
MQNITELIKNKDVEGLRAFAVENNMVVKEGKLVPRDEASKKSLHARATFFNNRQQARKILLNSLNSGH